MSQYEYKAVLRFCDENINNSREHLKKMREWTGREPRWVEGEGDDILFSYMPLTDRGMRVQHTPNQRPFFMDVSSNRDGQKLFGLDLVLAWTVGDPPDPVRIHQRTFDGAMQEIMSATNCEPWEIGILFYGWYNGGDEPIEW